MQSRTVLIYAMIFTFLLVLVGVPTLILAVLSQAAALTSGVTATAASAKVPQGTLFGELTTQAAIFRGIPFSQPPTENHRWRKPREPLNFPNGTWNATYFRPGCPQHCTYKSKEFSCPTETDEDCLYLNIWVPHAALPESNGDCAKSSEPCKIVIPQPEERQETFKQLPVIVYLHGGNFMTGAGSSLLYESRFLAEQGSVIIVTTNFRLGALAFLVHGDGDDAANGNYGLWDQIKAMQWVQKNIKYFGGNPNKVTLLGQSSGAESVSVLLTSPYSKNLFRHAGLASNPFSLPFRDLRNAKQFGNSLVSTVGCKIGNMSCLRRIAVQDIVKTAHESPSNFFQIDRKLLAIQPWGPVVDGDLLTKMPLESFASGEVSPKPLIMGTTTGEGMFFITALFSQKLSTIFYNFAVTSLFGPGSSVILDQYPANCSVMCDNRDKLGDIVTDYIFTCPTRRALLSGKNNNQNEWFYIFDQKLPFSEFWDSELCDNVACHSADLPFIFNNVELANLRFNEKERLLAKRIGRYWTNFAKYGNPNGQNFHSDSRELFTTGPYQAEYWPRFNELEYGTYTALKLQGDGDSIRVEPSKHICDFWDGLNSYGEYRR